MDVAGGSGVDGWFILGIIALVVGILCFILLAVGWIRKRRAAQGKKAEDLDLAGAWRKAVAAMPQRERDGPVVVVLGERLSGKTTLIRGALKQGDRYTPDGRDLDVYSGNGQRVQEIASDLLFDPRPEAEDALRKLWKGVALEALRVIVVVNASSLSWNDAGLRDLGRVVRRKLELLTDLRGSPVNVRVAVTHCDARSAGFSPLCDILEETNARGPIAPRESDELPPEWRRVTPLGARTTRFPELVGFVSSEGPETVRALAPFFESLLASTKDAPIVNGVFLSAATELEPFRSTGDALAEDPELANSDRRARERRFITRVGLALAAALALGAIVFTVQRSSVERTASAVTIMADAVSHGDRVSRTVEEKAAAEVLRMDRSAWLFESRRAEIEEQYRTAVETGMLNPKLQSTDRAARIRALSVLDAGKEGDPLRAIIQKDEAAWAAALGMSPRTLKSYLTVSDGAGPTEKELSNLPEITALPRGSSRADWASFFRRLSDVLHGQRLRTEPLKELQDSAGDLDQAVHDAAEQTELDEAARILQARHPHQKNLFGKGTTSDAGPWMQENAGTLQHLLAAVRGASLDGPSGAGKGLRQAVLDLQVIAVPPEIVEPKAREATAETQADNLLDRLKQLVGTAAPPAAGVASAAAPAAGVGSARSSAAPAAPAAPASASASAAPSGSAPSTAAASAAPEAKKPPVYTVVLDAQSWSFDMGQWAQAIVAGRALVYLDALFADSSRRSVLFPKDAAYPPVLPQPGRGASTYIDGLVSHEAFTAEVEPGLAGFEAALASTGLDVSEREIYLRPTRSAASSYGAGLRDATDAYYKSFQLSRGGASALAADVADIVSPSSFFTTFQKRVADQASIPGSPGTLLRLVGDPVADFGPIARLLTGENGKYPALEPYYKLLITLVPSLSDRAPPAPKRDAPLDDRLAPIGALALSALRTPAKSPDAEVEAWLNDASVTESLRRPFRLAVQRALALGKADLDRAAADAYTAELRPSVTPILGRFPFDTRSTVDAQAADVEATFGPKGTFFASFASLIGPVCREGPAGSYTPLEVPSAGAVEVPAGALRLASWAQGLQKMLFGPDGKPQPIAFRVKAPPLSPVEPERTITLALLQSGTATFYAFNQAPSWQPFPVAWSPAGGQANTSSVGIQTTPTGGGEPRIQTIDVAAADFSFFHLIQRAEVAGSKVTWKASPESPGDPRRYAAFLFEPNPAGLLRAPSLD